MGAWACALQATLGTGTYCRHWDLGHSTEEPVKQGRARTELNVGPSLPQARSSVGREAPSFTRLCPSPHTVTYESGKSHQLALEGDRS